MNPIFENSRRREEGRRRPPASTSAAAEAPDLVFRRPKGLLAGFIAQAPGGVGSALLEVGEQWVGRDWKIGAHANAGWELYFQTQGASEWRCGRTAFLVPVGGYYLIAPGVRHELVRFIGRASHYYFVVFDSARLDHPGASSWRRPFRAGAGGHTLETPLRGLVREVSLRQTRKDRGVRLYLEALCLEIDRLQESSHGLEPDLAVHPAALRARELMIERPGDRWRADELAGLCGISVPHLIEVFRRSFGLSPHRFLVKHRLHLARERLEQRSCRITELALELGFSSSQHFAGAYRREFGSTPSARQILAMPPGMRVRHRHAARS